MRLRSTALVGMVLPTLALLTGCGAQTAGPESLMVAGGASVTTRDQSKAAISIQLLLDGKIVDSASGPPSGYLAGSFPNQRLTVGRHKMQLKLVDQLGVNVTYKVTASVTMRRGASGFDIWTYQWPYLTLTLKAGALIDFVFTVR